MPNPELVSREVTTTLRNRLITDDLPAQRRQPVDLCLDLHRNRSDVWRCSGGLKAHPTLLPTQQSRFASDQPANACKPGGKVGLAAHPTLHPPPHKRITLPMARSAHTACRSARALPGAGRIARAPAGSLALGLILRLSRPWA